MLKEFSYKVLDVFMEFKMLQFYLHPNCVLFDGDGYGDDGTSHLINISNYVLDTAPVTL